MPPQLAGSLGGSGFLRRITALEACGHVFLDSISYAASDVLPAAIVRDLQAGVRPIGHLIDTLCTCQVFRRQDTQLFQQLWTLVGAPDPQASRSCLIVAPDGPCMALAETFRRGVLSLAEREDAAPIDLHASPAARSAPLELRFALVPERVHGLLVLGRIVRQRLVSTSACASVRSGTLMIVFESFSA